MSVEQVVVICFTVAAAGAGFVAKARRQGVDNMPLACGTAVFSCGLATTLLMMLTDSIASQVLLFVPGVVCVGEAAGITRNRFAAQKRTLLASLAILGFSLPFVWTEPYVTVLAVMSLACIGLLLSSRTDIRIVQRIASNITLLNRFPERTTTCEDRLAGVSGDTRQLIWSSPLKPGARPA